MFSPLSSKQIILTSLLCMILSCGRIEYSPWQTNVPSISFNDRNLYLISKQKQTYPFKVGLLSDPHGDPEAFREQLEHLNKRDDLNFNVVTGDLTTYGLKDEFEWILAAMKNSKAPILAIPGNHDGVANGKVIYKKMFGEYSYVFNYANHKFVMWNNNKFEWLSEPNWPWLASQLDSKSILMSHIPPIVDVYDAEEVDFWTNLMKEKNIQISIHGHLHHASLGIDENNIKHYVISASIHRQYGIMTVYENSIEIETCQEDRCIKQ